MIRTPTMRAWRGALLLLFLVSAPGGAIEPGTYRYRIDHSLHGDIGSHLMTVTIAADGRLIVDHQADIEVTVLAVPVYFRTVVMQEVWQDGRLLRFHSRVDDNGEVREVAARAEGDVLLIEGVEGMLRAPARTAPNQPSFEGAIDRATFFRIASGELVEARVVGSEQETLEMDGASLATTRYTLAGGREERVWFGPGGLFVKWELDPGGGLVTLVRENAQN